VTIDDIAGLARIRHWASRKAHDDESLAGLVVILTRHRSTVGRIACASLDLARDAYRICAGIRFRREDGPALDALPLLLAA
jgi:hypothetical protein